LATQLKQLGFSIKNMDPSADPRQDFYRFAAGGWLDKAVIADTDAQVSDIMNLVHLVTDQIVSLLEKAAASSENEPKGSVTQQVGDMYASAMDMKRLEVLRFKPLQPDLERIDAISDMGDLASVIAHLELITYNPVLLTVAVLPDKKQSDLNILQVYPSSLSMPNRDFYLKLEYESVRTHFLGLVAEALQRSGIPAEEAAERAKTVLAIETAMAEASLSPLEKADPEAQYHPMSVPELKALAPRFDFDTVFANLGLKVDGHVNVGEPRYMEMLNDMLAERPLEDFKSYLRWRLILSLAQYLDPAVEELFLDFYVKKLQGNTQLLPREKRVATEIKNKMGHPVAQLYVREHFPAETRQYVEEMVHRVKAQFKTRLEENPWLDGPTRAFALDKLEKMQIYVGYPDNWIDHSGVEIWRDDYLGNMMRINQFSAARDLAKLGQPVVVEEFAYPGHTLPTDINAAYQPQHNKIELTAAILQPPFYYPDKDAAVNYGAIGAVIGHEMTHGFDSIGRRFDAQGNMHDWWTPNDNEEFEALTNVLVEQFNQYEVLPDLYVNGKLTVTENTADLGGVILAFEAMKNAIAGGPPLADIDGYSQEERFFVAWAQLWMSKMRPEMSRQLISRDPHTPSAFRATGPLVNFDAFFDTFGIESGDGMWRDGAERARIW